MNSMYLICMPKGVRPEEGSVIARAASQTRPLGLKNTDVKVVASCVARSVHHGLQVRVSDRQRGFLRGRLATDNTAELDAAARVAALEAETSEDPEFVPLLWALDIRDAFPTLARPFMKESLKVSGLPVEVRRFSLATWRHNEAAIVTAPPEAATICIVAGVTQGCPPSSTLFVLSFDALLELLSTTARGVRLVKAFADDVGAISASVAALTSIPRALAVMRKASGLEPAPKKTHLVLLAPHRPELHRRASEAIGRLAHPWSAMTVRGAALYLAAMVGPSAGATIWAAPLQKWRSRVGQVSAAHVSAASRLTQYEVRVLPVLGYTAQLRAPPSDIGRLERVALERLLKVPHNAVPTAVMRALPRIGGVCAAAPAVAWLGQPGDR